MCTCYHGCLFCYHGTGRPVLGPHCHIYWHNWLWTKQADYFQSHQRFWRNELYFHFWWIYGTHAGSSENYEREKTINHQTTSILHCKQVFLHFCSCWYPFHLDFLPYPRCWLCWIRYCYSHLLYWALYCLVLTCSRHCYILCSFSTLQQWPLNQRYRFWSNRWWSCRFVCFILYTEPSVWDSDGNSGCSSASGNHE